MHETTEVTRSIELDLEPAEVWELIGEGARWADWMVDTAEVEIVPGATGRIDDGDEQRDVRIDTVADGEGVSFTWWPVGRDEEASAVELHIVPQPDVTVLEVVERFPAQRVVAVSLAGRQWHARASQLGALRRLLVAA